MTHNQASKTLNGKEAIPISKKREKHKQRLRLEDLFGTSDIIKVFSKGGETNWSYKLYTISEIFQVTFPSYKKKLVTREIQRESFEFKKFNS